MSDTEPVAWRWHAEGEVRWTFGAYAPSNAFVKQPLYAQAKVRQRDEICPRLFKQENDMHPMMTDVIVKEVRQRISEGDCPSVRARGTEALEFAIEDLAGRLDAANALISDLSSDLTDVGANYSTEGLQEMRKRVAKTLGKAECPEWLHEYLKDT